MSAPRTIRIPAASFPVDAPTVPFIRTPERNAPGWGICQRCEQPIKLVESDRTEYPVWVHAEVKSWFNDPHTAEA